MKITIFGHETIITDDVKQYTNEKINKLAKYHENIIGVDITLEENHHQKKKNHAFMAKSLIQIPGKDLSAKAEGQTLFAAVDALEAKISNQLLKLKEKRVFKRTRLSRSKALLRKLFKQ